MTNLDAQSILLREREYYKKYNNTQEILDAIDLAILALEKQIPVKPIIKSDYSPALCPLCNEELSEHLGDGYYKHYYGRSICECGQKLRWD